MGRVRLLLVVGSFMMTACSGGSTGSYTIVPGASSHGAATQNPRRPDIRSGEYGVIHEFGRSGRG